MSFSAVSNQVPVHIYQHSREAKHPLGTVRILALGLERCEVERVGNDEGFPIFEPSRNYLRKANQA